MKFFYSAILLMSIFSGANAQRGDTTWRRNTVKLDVTSYWLYRNAIVFSYERVVKNHPNHTWSVTAGSQEFPAFSGLDNVNVRKDSKATGLKLGAEYRFYLKKENKYGAPHGVYLGPYTSFHNYSNTRTIEVNNNGTIETAVLDADLDILNIGFQLGYQFVINNRWTIDLVFVGPSVSNYRFKSKMSGNFTFDTDDITNEVVLGLIEKFPAIGELIDEGEVVSNGKIDYWGYGYRYQLQVGYHFGRKKK